VLFSCSAIQLDRYTSSLYIVVQNILLIIIACGKLVTVGFRGWVVASALSWTIELRPSIASTSGARRKHLIVVGSAA